MAYWSEINSSYFSSKIIRKEQIPWAGQSFGFNAHGHSCDMSSFWNCFFSFKTELPCKNTFPFSKNFCPLNVWNSGTEVTENLSCLLSTYWHFLPSFIFTYIGKGPIQFFSLWRKIRFPTMTSLKWHKNTDSARKPVFQKTTGREWELIWITYWIAQYLTFLNIFNIVFWISFH